MKFSKSKAAAFFENSAIMRFSKKCYDNMLTGFFGSLLTGYWGLQQKFENGIFGRGERERPWNESFLSRTRRKIIVSYENSSIIGALSKFGDMLLGFQVRFYGFFFLYFGICSILINLIKRFALPQSSASYLDWVVGAILAFAAFPMLTSGKSLAAASQNSLLFGKIIFDLLGFKETDIKKYSSPQAPEKRYFLAALFGAIFGCTTIFVPPLLAVLALCGVVWAVTVYKKPEVGVLSCVFFAPFLSFIGSPSMFLAALIIYSFICILIKVFLGKVVARIELSDAFVGIFMFIMLLAGIASIGGVASLKKAAIYTCFMLIYFMITWLITTKEWLMRLTFTLVSSGTLTALYGLYQKISGNVETGTIDKDMFGDIGGRITSTFENSNMLGVFLIMIFPFALSFVFEAKKPLSKLFALGSCGIMGLCILFTWSRGAWLGLILACGVFVLFYNHYIIPLLIPAGALGITLVWDKIGGNGLVTDLVSRFSSIVTMSDTSSVYRLGIWRGSLKAATENWFTGIGIGEEAFRKIYIKFAESGIETAVHSHNLFLQIFIETGIMGIIVFVVSIVLCIMGGLELCRKSTSYTKAEKSIAVSAISGLLAALMQGMTDFIWFNYRIFFFFWVITALISASSRIGRSKLNAKREY